MFSSFSDFSSLFLVGSGMIRPGKERCVWQVNARSESPTHLRTEQRNMIVQEVGGGILLNEIRVMDGCQLSLGFCKYRNSTKTEMCQTGGFGKNLNWTGYYVLVFSELCLRNLLLKWNKTKSFQTSRCPLRGHWKKKDKRDFSCSKNPQEQNFPRRIARVHWATVCLLLHLFKFFSLEIRWCQP